MVRLSVCILFLVLFSLNFLSFRMRYRFRGTALILLPEICMTPTVVGRLAMIDFRCDIRSQAAVNTLRATSRGTVTLKSSDPNEHPFIDPNYLSTPDDVQDLRTGVRVTRQVKSNLQILYFGSLFAARSSELSIYRAEWFIIHGLVNNYQVPIVQHVNRIFSF